MYFRMKIIRFQLTFRNVIKKITKNINIDNSIKIIRLQVSILIFVI